LDSAGIWKKGTELPHVVVHRPPTSPLPKKKNCLWGIISMSSPLLTFKINEEQENVEIHANAEGVAALIRWLEVASRTNDHQHLMTPEWGGVELSSEPQGSSNRLVNHVRIVPWDGTST